jgi:O-antigen ligase
MVHEEVIEFRHLGVPDHEIAVTVQPGSEPPPVLSATSPWPDPEEIVLPTLSRPALWQAAVQMWLERPLLGHGANNFRLLHGRYLGLDDWDTHVNANNLYLETAAGTGLVGLAALFWLIAAAGRLLVRLYRRPPGGQAALWAAGLAAALIAFLAHGLLDYFLDFTAVYLALGLILGLVVALEGGRAGDGQVDQRPASEV